MLDEIEGPGCIDLTPKNGSRLYVGIHLHLDLKGRSDNGEATAHNRTDHQQAA